MAGRIQDVGVVHTALSAGLHTSDKHIPSRVPFSAPYTYPILSMGATSVTPRVETAIAAAMMDFAASL